MASNINPDSIDEAFPVAGVDNDSQGFRDNFDVIKTNFIEAKNNIEDLQDNVVRSDQNNNLLGTRFIDAELDQSTESFTAIGTVNASQNVSFLNGHYQTVSVTSPLTITLADWPGSTGTTRYARMTVELISDGGAYDITFIGENSAEIRDDNNGWTSQGGASTTISVDSDTHPRILEFWTYNGGGRIYARNLGKFGEGNV